MSQEIAVFEIGGEYLFKQFFDDGTVFKQLSQFYDDNRYRFALPDEAALDRAREIVAEAGYELTVVEDIAPCCVVKKRDQEYGEILKDAVAREVQGDYNVFVMRSESAAEQAELHGATPLAETDLRAP